MFHYFWRVSSFKLDFLSHFWVNSISFWTHQNPLSLRIQKMSLLFQIGPPKVELWPFKHLKHSFWTSCQNGGKTFLFLFLQLFFFQTVHFSTLFYRRQNGGKGALVCSSQTVHNQDITKYPVQEGTLLRVQCSTVGLVFYIYIITTFCLSFCQYKYCL